MKTTPVLTTIPKEAAGLVAETIESARKAADADYQERRTMDVEAAQAHAQAQAYLIGLREALWATRDPEPHPQTEANVASAADAFRTARGTSNPTVTVTFAQGEVEALVDALDALDALLPERSGGPTDALDHARVRVKSARLAAQEVVA